MSNHRKENDHPVLEKKRIAASIIQRLLIAAIALWFVSAMALIVYDVRQGADERHILLDCTQPGGKCFEASQKRTAEAVRILDENRLKQHQRTRLVVIFAARCASVHQGATANVIKRCVNKELDREGIKR